MYLSVGISIFSSRDFELANQNEVVVVVVVRARRRSIRRVIRRARGSGVFRMMGFTVAGMKFGLIRVQREGFVWKVLVGGR